MNKINYYTGLFDTENLANLEGTGVFQNGSENIWHFDGKEINLKDAKGLKNLMHHYRRKAQYKEAKFVNRILCQLDFAERNETVNHFPGLLQLEHTDICNSRCIMCNHYFTKNHGCRFIDMNVIREMEEYLPYVDYIVLNGIGEPLLHPNIMELMSTYEKYGIQMTTNTNMSVMNPELAKIMHRTFTDIQISCDGSNAETYENIRRGLKFDQFVKNVKMLREAGSTEICMATVVMRQNIEELPQIVELAADLGCDKVVMLDLNMSELLQTQNDTLMGFPRVAAYYMEKAKETAARRNIFIHTLDYVKNLDNHRTLEEETKLLHSIPKYRDDKLAEELYEMYKQIDFINPVFAAENTDYCTPSRYRSEGYCQFIENRPFISANGDIFNCCMRRMHSMGNLNEKGFEEIWNGEPMRKIRRMLNSGQLPKYCVGCAYFRGELMTDRLRVLNEDREFYEDVYDRLRMEIINGKRRENGNL